MPEIKHNFTGGKMNKDLDERLVPNGEYRHAENVQVSTSDDSDVGTVQNIFSNRKISGYFQDQFLGNDKSCVGSIADEKNNAVYWFLTAGDVADISNAVMNYDFTSGSSSNNMPYFDILTEGSSIMEYKSDGSPQVRPVVVEASKVILPLQNYFQISVVTQQGPALTTYPIFFAGQQDSVLAGMNLTTVYVLQNTWSSGTVPVVTNTLDFSSGFNYTPLVGVSPPGGLFSPNPPYVVGNIQNGIQLSNMPDTLLAEITAGSILAFEFSFSIDAYKLPLNFQSNNIITGINIIDDMLFWTDNYNEPKKINITRCKQGTPSIGSSFYGFTRLINERTNITVNDNIPLEEKHVTVIRKPPSKAPVLNLKTGRDYSGVNNPLPQVYTGVVTVGLDASPNPNNNDDILDTSSSFNTDPYDFSGVNIGDTVELRIQEDVYGNDLTTGGFELIEWAVGKKVVLKEYEELSSTTPEPPPIPITDYRIKGEIIGAPTGFTASAGNPIIVEIEITNIDGFPPGADPNLGYRKYAIDLFDTYEKLFEFKFPRFATRYKYSDGEYSTYSPFTQVAFLPGTFDYHPKKGYNLGMTNRITQIDVVNFRLNDTPLDVVEIDILYKEDGSPNVYVVDTIQKDSVDDYWDADLYTITHETIKATIPSNQLLRSWDNVPKTALAQEITGNRIVYGNYTQGWDVFDLAGNPYSPSFKWQILDSSSFLSWDNYQTDAIKSIKSLREYQLGVVFIDEYGRETPVISNPSGTFEVDYSRAAENNRLRVGFQSDPPRNQKYYKFYIKQTSGEYYNLAMDRWYDAEDGNIWLSFPSSDRNKIDIDTFLVLKKAAETNDPVATKSRYKVLAIEDNAPDFVRTKVTKLVKAKHTNTANSVFLPNTTNNAPVSGTDTFEMNYNFFGNSSGSRLHEIDDGELYFSLSLQGSTVESNRYRIASITTNAFDGSSVTDPKYFIKTDKFLEDDVNFATDDPSGAFSTEIQDNVNINIFKYKVENLPIFDGKFFVKIYIDDTFKNYISQSTTQSEEWRRVASKTIYSMRSNHDQTHGPKPTGHGEEPVSGAKSAYSTAFGRFACYFRRYDYGNKEMPTIAPSGTLNLSTSKYRFNSPGNNNTNFTANNPAPWYSEWYEYTGWGNSIGGTNVYYDTYDDASALDYFQSNKQADQFAKKDEVWFLDMYRHVDKVTNTANSIIWNNYPSSNANPFTSIGSTMSGGNTVPPPVDGGAASGGNTTWHHFRLTLGPILNKVIKNNDAWAASALDQSNDEGILNATLDPVNGLVSSNFFAIGTGNVNYQDPSTTNFTDRLNPGNTWRWAEDPKKTQYNLNQQVNESNLIRYRSDGGTSGAGNILRNDKISDERFGATQLSVNFNKRWAWVQEHDNVSSNGLDWIPVDSGNQSGIGPITGNGIKTILRTAIPSNSEHPYGNHDEIGEDNGDVTTTGTCTGIDEHYIVVTNDSFETATDQNGNPCRVIPGFIITNFTNASGATTSLLANSTTDPFLVVRDVSDPFVYNSVFCRRIYLTGYVEALDIAHTITIDPDTDVTFKQATMNGYSPNSAARISLQKSTTGLGAFTNTTLSGVSLANVAAATTNLLYAVGYTMEFIQPSYDNEVLPENPAIWETEPKDTPELDVYYEASDLIPIELTEDTDSGFLPLTDETTGSSSLNIGTFLNCTIQAGPSITGFTIPSNTEVIDVQENVLILSQTPIGVGGNAIAIGSSDYVHIKKPDGSIFSTRVESISNNELTIDAFTWQHYHTLNWHNCYSFGNGVESDRIRDNFNLPFISNGVRASSTLDEKIEKENRRYGLIFSGIYNDVTSLNELNQFISAEKITKEINPIYGSIQKLHSRSTADGDLITLCEDRVLKILATKDAIFNADGNPQLTANVNVLGQTIPFVGEYGISQNPESFASESYRAYFTDKQRGAVMRLSRDGLTPISDHGMKDWFRDNLKLGEKLIGSYDDKKDEYNIAIKTPEDTTLPEYVVSFREDMRGWVSFKSFTEIESGVSMASNYYTFKDGKIFEHHYENNGFNTFYGRQHPSSIQVLLNEMPDTVKSFKTLSYEGSQAKITQDLDDNQYFNLQAEQGWFLQDINTNLQVGQNVEFIEKENKWFNYIKGVESDVIEEKDFTYQGIDVVSVSQLRINNNSN